jgi:uncharacterized protein
LIDPVTFADRQRVLIGQIPLAKFTRLADALLNKEGQVEIDLSFSKKGRLAIVIGSIKTCLVLECSSCLEALNFPIEIEVSLAVVKSLTQAEQLAGEYEPLMLEDEKIPLHEIVEDELLLALPTFPRHEQDCIAYQQIVKNNQPKPSSEAQPKTNNPFSVLAQLKNIGD